ncbi:MAG: DUF4328 domain-containing protein [Chitinophagaceae bacterium]|nr:DUF4328 domain-containing protein [Chitinophagaceae bacterium]
MISLRPNDQRAKAAIILIYIVMAIDVLSAVSGFMQYQLLERANELGGVSTEEAYANDLREQIISYVFLVAYIVSIVLFIRWFRRAYYNLHQLPVSVLFTEGWAAGAWFVPFVNLGRPYKIMKDLYTESRSYLQRKEVSFTHLSSTTMIGIWWTLWLVSGFLGQFVLRYGMKAETIDELIVATVAETADHLLGIPLGLAAIKVIKDYAAAEPLLAIAAAQSAEVSDSGDYLNAWSAGSAAAEPAE